MHGEEVLDIVETAQKELKIDRKLKAIDAAWKELNLGFKPYREDEGEDSIQIMVYGEDVVEALEAHQMELQGMVGMGRFVDFFRSQVENWQKTLGNIEDTLKV